MRHSKDDALGALAAIQAETVPIEGHGDPGAIQDCFATVREFIEQSDLLYVAGQGGFCRGLESAYAAGERSQNSYAKRMKAIAIRSLTLVMSMCEGKEDRFYKSMAVMAENDLQLATATPVIIEPIVAEGQISPAALAHIQELFNSPADAKILEKPEGGTDGR